MAGLRLLPALLRPGDWAVLLLGLAGVAAVWGWGREGAAERVRVMQDGRLYAEADLRLDRLFAVPGPLGVTEVEIRGGRVRVKADPSPRQICVQQGWLAPGQAAMCLPNRVSVERGRLGYDSLNY